MKNRLKLFIWTGFSPDYSSGLAFAIAKDEMEAKILVEEKRGCEIYDWGTLEIRPINRRVARSVSGGS